MSAHPLAADLTPSQIRTLAVVADSLLAGKTHAEAAHSLGVAEQTVKNSLALTRAALGARSTVHAIALMDQHRPGWRTT